MDKEYTDELLVAKRDGSAEFSNLTNYIISEKTGKLIVSGQISDADVRRVVACWNACHGIPTEQVEFFSKEIASIIGDGPLRRLPFTLPVGYKLAPLVANSDMVRAGERSEGRSSGKHMESPSIIYRDMIEVAPQPGDAAFVDPAFFALKELAEACMYIEPFGHSDANRTFRDEATVFMNAVDNASGTLDALKTRDSRPAEMLQQLLDACKLVRPLAGSIAKESNSEAMREAFAFSGTLTKARKLIAEGPETAGIPWHAQLVGSVAGPDTFRAVITGLIDLVEERAGEGATSQDQIEARRRIENAKTLIGALTIS
jgi:hypothetical protein